MITSKIIDRINRIKRAGGIYSPRRQPVFFLKTFYAKHRAHLSLSHYSIGLFPFALLAQLLNMLTGGDDYLRAASVFMTVCGTVMLVPAVLSGFASFAVNFKWKIKGNINLKIKLLFSPFIFFFGIVASLMGIMPEVPLGWSYAFLLALITIMLLVIESNGKKLTFREFNQ